MRVDQAWHHDHAGGVDHLGVFNRQIRTHGGDPVRRDEDVRTGVVANFRIVAQHQACFEQRAVRCVEGSHDVSPSMK